MRSGYATLVDMRERSLVLTGQEILTADKVGIRVSSLVNFRVTDARTAVHNVSPSLGAASQVRRGPPQAA